jgi:hypothetical protein
MQRVSKSEFTDTKMGEIVLINSLEKMEEIVENNKDLSWDGWTVIENKTKENGAMSKDGAYVGGKWIVQKRYDATTSGWEIPNKFMR